MCEIHIPTLAGRSITRRCDLIISLIVCVHLKRVFDLGGSSVYNCMFERCIRKAKFKERFRQAHLDSLNYMMQNSRLDLICRSNYLAGNEKATLEGHSCLKIRTIM